MPQPRKPPRTRRRRTEDHPQDPAAPPRTPQPPARKSRNWTKAKPAPPARPARESPTAARRPPARQSVRQRILKVRPNDELIHQPPPDSLQHDVQMGGTKAQQRHPGPRFASLGESASRACLQVLNLEASPSSCEFLNQRVRCRRTAPVPRGVRQTGEQHATDVPVDVLRQQSGFGFG